ncbi:zinc finger protein [Streptoalloteichus hindustanus]|uniref:Zinc-finger n=1 Tax=Streptoalloteichus hindustanus TaxID=2017 RepID=A0A1M5DPH1_STRHI|nr:zinc finger protein [Streptoalloteichus hindustanus]SHF68889.1 zinc-finger [Streptoalloteichus hindustanus]
MGNGFDTTSHTWQPAEIDGRGLRHVYLGPARRGDWPVTLLCGPTIDDETCADHNDAWLWPTCATCDAKLREALGLPFPSPPEHPCRRKLLRPETESR